MLGKRYKKRVNSVYYQSICYIIAVKRYIIAFNANYTLS